VTAVLDEETHCLHGMLDDLYQTDTLPVQSEATLRDLRDVEEVFDQPIELLRLPPRDVQRSLGLPAVELGTGDRVSDGRHRVAQLVTEHCQELVLGATRCLRLGNRAQSDLEQLLAVCVGPLPLDSIAGTP
jgi:hypothetical protein